MTLAEMEQARGGPPKGADSRSQRKLCRAFPTLFSNPGLRVPGLGLQLIFSFGGKSVVARRAFVFDQENVTLAFLSPPYAWL